jgi:hypothetical protein
VRTNFSVNELVFVDVYLVTIQTTSVDYYKTLRIRNLWEMDRFCSHQVSSGLDKQR